MIGLDFSAISQMTGDELQEFVAGLSEDEAQLYYEFVLGQIDKARIDELVETAKTFSEEGFFAYYEVITGTVMPDHGRDWINKMFESVRSGKGHLTFAFRGSWKTSILSVQFTGYFIGHHPKTANLIVQASDESARELSAAVAKIIVSHPGWKRIFPDIVPDKEQGWGAGSGYEVWDQSMTREEWVFDNASRKDPTLLAAGIGSSTLIGRHPDGVFIWDDLHDDKNSVSELERSKIVRILTDTMMPMSVSDVHEGKPRKVTWELAIGTPWEDDDAYHYLRNTNEYGFSKTPVMKQVPYEMPGAFYIAPEEYEDIQGWWMPTWGDRFPKETILAWRRKTGQRGFARMYLLDLVRAKATGVKFAEYPSEMIKVDTWISSGGLDYASVLEDAGKPQNLRGRSEFAFCWGFKLPLGGAVIHDGVHGHFTQLEGEGLVERTQNMIVNYMTTAVEMNGKGEEFYAVLQRKPYLQLMPFWTGKTPKNKRIEHVVAPLLESGQLLISDADTPYLNALRKSFQDFPDGNTDVRDAVYAFVQTIPEAFDKPDPNYSNRGSNTPLPIRQRRRKSENVFSAFGSN